MAELADAADSKSADLRVLGVRLPLPAPNAILILPILPRSPSVPQFQLSFDISQRLRSNSQFRASSGACWANRMAYHGARFFTLHGVCNACRLDRFPISFTKRLRAGPDQRAAADIGHRTRSGGWPIRSTVGIAYHSRLSHMAEPLLRSAHFNCGSFRQVHARSLDVQPRSQPDQ